MIVYYLRAYGPNILGHGNLEYVAALKDFLDTLSPAMASSVAFTRDDVELAKKFIKRVPCVEKIKSSVTDTDAVQTALRLARAFSGRDCFIWLEQHYHGLTDNVLGGLANKNAEGRPFAINGVEEDVVDTTGRAESAVENLSSCLTAILKLWKVPWGKWLGIQ